MIATIVNNNDIIISHVTTWEENMLDDKFSASKENRYIDDSHMQSWDGVYRRYNRSNGRLARTFLGELVSFCRSKNLSLIVRDDRDKSNIELIDKDQVTEDLLPGIKLKSFQIDAIKKVYGTEVGLFGIATGGGKTEVMAGICKIVQCQTTILCDQTVVIDQIKERLELREVCQEVGLFYAGKTPKGQLVVVGTVQSLLAPKKRPPEPKPNAKGVITDAAKIKHVQMIKAFKTRAKNAKILQNLIKKSEMLLVDEADLATSDIWKNLFRHWFKGRRRYGFTGTPDLRCPVKKLILHEHLGGVVFRQSRQEVEDAGLTVPLEYDMLVVGNYKDKSSKAAFDIAVDDLIVYNKQLHNLIAALCAKHSDVGTMILVERDDLGNALCDLIPDSAFHHGKTSKKEKNRIISDFEERKLKVLIGGKTVRRGLDLRGGCEVLILASGGKDFATFDQGLGRARRRNKDGKSHVYDFYFLGNEYLYEHSRLRLRSAVDIGVKTRVIFPNAIICGEELINRRFKPPAGAFARR